ncbi:cytochrome P450 [Spongiactinospora rosea]|uniref:Cytochrome P450 n=2 Tax=Spongiactinospora rosea TaxID=2248750 RepID=A0A366LZR7_9ACTN|nr:cytochrome P450 [Spongiactinospora rosea]
MRDPHSLYQALRDQGPVRPARFHSRLPGWLVTGYAEARQLLGDPRLSKDSARALELFPPGTAGAYASALSAHMLNSDPPDHTRLRELVNKVFTARAVARLRPRIEQIATDLVDAMAPGGSADLIEVYAFPLPITVICEVLGVPDGDRDRFREWTRPFVGATDAEELARAQRELTAYMDTLVAAKRAAHGDDLLSELTRVSDAGDRLSHAELVSMAFLLLVAGHETTVNLIGNSVLALLRNPAQMAALRADPSLLPAAVEEFLRYDGPINIATVRFTTAPVSVGGVEIPAGEFVMISLLAANRDAGRFPDPDLLDLARPAAGHLGFGHGVHHCLGAPLARLEAQIALGRLLGRFPAMTLDADPADLRWRDSTLIHGLHSLPVRLA